MTRFMKHRRGKYTFEYAQALYMYKSYRFYNIVSYIVIGGYDSKTFFL